MFLWHFLMLEETDFKKNLESFILWKKLFWVHNISYSYYADIFLSNIKWIFKIIFPEFDDIYKIWVHFSSVLLFHKTIAGQSLQSPVQWSGVLFKKVRSVITGDYASKNITYQPSRKPTLTTLDPS